MSSPESEPTDPLASIEPFELSDPTTDYIKQLETAGYVVLAHKFIQNEEGKEVTRFKAVVMEAGEYADRLSELNARRLSAAKRTASAFGCNFQKASSLPWSETCSDSRLCEAPTELAAIEGALRNWFDLDYEDEAA